ncbi:MAG: hypothetical protein HN768_15480 [Rhodospirillaceae bacterium]|nr:hypothetical protein [Rhodospirillaceae bacterium]
MATPRVLVLSFCHTRNFGDRLGFHLLNAVLPPDAETVFQPMSPFRKPPHDSWDLVIVGIGNSLNPSNAKVLYDPLMRLFDTSRHVVGISGTQYRELFVEERLIGLLGRFDHWYARYGDDLALYGGHARKASHLGDWLIDAFPLTRPTRDSLLRLEADVMTKRHPLDWLIRAIQAHRHVFSPRLHTLLCALCSAERVAYVEQFEDDEHPEVASGKFNSMLQDIFGRSYAQRDLFTVDRDAVIAYRRFVRGNIGRLRSDIGELI